MTTAAFEQSVTDAINVKLLDAQGREQKYRAPMTAPDISDALTIQAPDNVAPHIAKIPLRVEYRALLQAAEAYEHNARRHDEEAERLRTLAKQAREQGENLKSKANL
jgi:hypothetical protein